MKLFKKHLGLLVAIVLVIFLVIGIYIAKQFFLSNDMEAIYGSRLEGMKEVKITKDQINQIKDALAEHTDSCNVRTQGRILYVDAYGKEGLTLDTARAFGGIVLEKLSEGQINYYDIQIMVGSKTNENDFPLIGYKHHTKGEYSWVNKKVES